MSCEDVRDRLGEWIVGALEGDANDAVAAHVEACPRCRSEVHSLHALEDRIRTLPVPVPTVRPQVVRRPGARLGLAAAAAMLLVIVGIIVRGPVPSAAGAGKDAYGDPLPPGVVARLGTTRFRHADVVRCVVADERAVFSGGDDGVIRQWEPSTGREVRVYRGHEGGIGSVALSEDGKTLLSSGGDGTIRAWDVGSGQELQRLGGYDAGSGAVVFSRSGKIAAWAGKDGTVSVSSLETGRELHRFGKQVAEVDLSRDGTIMASAGRDQTTRLWDVGTGRELREIDREELVTVVAVSPEGKTTATVHSVRSDGVGLPDIGVIRLWDTATGKLLIRIEPAGEGVECLAFSPDGRVLASAGEDNVIRLWDTATGQALRILKGHQHWVEAVAFSPDGRTLVSGGYDHTVRRWDAETGKEFVVAQGHGGKLLAVAFSPDGRRIATRGKDSAVRVWEAGTGKEVLKLESEVSSNASVAFSPEGTVLASGAHFPIRLWEIASGREVLRIPIHESFVVRFSPDGRTLASGSNHQKVRLWEAATGRPIRELAGLPSLVLAVSFSPDGSRVAAGGVDGVALVWEAATGKALLSLAGHHKSVPSMAYSPDGRLIATGDQARTVRFWDAQTGQEKVRWAPPDPVDDAWWAFPIAFSPDGKFLATSNGDATVLIREVATGAEVQRREGHAARVASLAFSPDGRRLVSASWDTTALVWDLSASGEPKADPEAAWRDLRGTDARRAYRAILSLAALEGKAVPFLKDRLREMAPDEKGLGELLEALQGDHVALRAKAAAELEKSGDERWVRAALVKAGSQEARARLEGVLAYLEGPFPKSAPVMSRIVQVLERVGTREAIELLRTLDTKDAKAALDRMKASR